MAELKSYLHKKEFTVATKKRQDSKPVRNNRTSAAVLITRKTHLASMPSLSVYASQPANQSTVAQRLNRKKTKAQRNVEQIKK